MIRDRDIPDDPLACRSGRTTRIIMSMPESLPEGERLSFCIPWPGMDNLIGPMIRKLRPGLKRTQVRFVTIQDRTDLWKLDGVSSDRIFADHTVSEFAKNDGTIERLDEIMAHRPML